MSQKAKLSYQAFVDRITSDTHYLQPETIDYIRTHSLRFYHTFVVCSRYLKAGDKVLSIGAGTGSIEKMLKEELGVELTVIDFPEAIDEWNPYFDHLGFIAVPADLSSDTLNLPKNYFNFLLSSEVIEHVPLSPYSQFRKFDENMAIGGKILITTPNHGSIMHLLKVLMMMPILESADKTFSEVGNENQGVHRREYFPCEIVDGFRHLGYRHVHTEFFFYKKAKNFAHSLLYLLGSIVPRFKYGMLLIGEKVK